MLDGVIVGAVLLAALAVAFWVLTQTWESHE
jgi:hypothetical protein